MKRILLGVSSLVLALALVVPAYAAPKKKKGAASDKVPLSAELANSMGDLKWGMSRDELQKKLIDKVKERYRPLVAKARDAVEEDSFRQRANDEIKSIRSSFVEFRGTSTGWDVSFLRGEFTHGNDETMIVMRDENSQNFYFFFDDKLWKWYKAFDAAVFRAGDFATFAGAVQRKFGPAKDARGELSPGSGERHWLEWHDNTTRLRAVDQTEFYGFYCLVFEDKDVVANLSRLRTNTQEVSGGRKSHALVDAVTSGGSDDPDTSPDIVDRITGKIRSRQDAPASGPSSAPSSSGTAKSGKSRASSVPSEGVSSDDDPLSGLGL